MVLKSKKFATIAALGILTMAGGAYLGFVRGMGVPSNFSWVSKSAPLTVNPPSMTMTMGHPVSTVAMEAQNALRTILSAYLFGQESVAKPSTVTHAQGEVPKTQQPLELHGIIYVALRPDKAVALIAQTGGMAKDYVKGDELPQGWKVHLILPEAVQIEHDGQIELLELPHSSVKLDNPNLEMKLNNGSSNANQETTETILSVGRAADGFVLNSTETATALGLLPADKIISISGYDFADLESDPSMLEQLLAQPSIDANVERNGEVINISVPKNLLKNWRTTIK
ncbi:MAG: hypothetical protein RL637_1124 [Pseudomonadota bacterium]|jgi:type II secretory pathway component PulC